MRARTQGADQTKMDVQRALAGVGLTLKDPKTPQAAQLRASRPEDSLLSDAIAAFYIGLETRNRSPHTRHFYETPLRLFGRWMEQETPGATCAQLTPETLDRFIYYLRHEHDTRLGDYTLHQYVKAIKILASWGTRSKRFWSTFPLPEYQLPQYTEGEIVPCTKEELRALIAAAGSTSSFVGRRLNAMLLVALDTGMRPGELRGATVDMLDVATGRLRLPAWLTKTCRPRSVHLQSGALAAVRSWLVARNALPGVDPNIGPLFCQLDGRGITFRAMNELGARLRVRSGVKRFHWHLLRHTAGTESLRNGADSLDVQEMLGHTTSHMTKRYLHLTDNDRQERHARFSPVQALLTQSEPREARFRRRKG